MKNCFFVFFLFSSTLVAMEPLFDSCADKALIPTSKECIKELRRKEDQSGLFDESPLLTAFAASGPLDFSCKQGDTFDINSLLRWAARNGQTKIIRTLAERGALRNITRLDFQEHIKSALNNLHDSTAVALLLGNPDFKVNDGPEDCYFTLLQRAANDLCVDFARTLLEGTYGAQVDGITAHVKETPLKAAAHARQNRNRYFCEPFFSDRQRAMINLLIGHGANSTLEVTTLHTRGYLYESVQGIKCSFVDWCVHKKYDDCLALLLEKNKLRGNHTVTEQCGKKLTVAEWAAQEGSLPMIKAMIPPEKGVLCGKIDVSDLLKLATVNLQRPIIDYLATHPAVRKKRSVAQEMLQTALAQGWDTTAKKLVDHYGKNVLCGPDDNYENLGLLGLAVQSKKPHMVRQLLDWGCDVHEHNAQGELPLVQSIDAKVFASTAMLLAAGAGTQPAIDKALAAAFFSLGTTAETYEQLLAYMPDLSAVREMTLSRYKLTPIELALQRNRALLQVLLEAGFDPNDWQQQAPLQVAIMCDWYDVVALLLQHGADPSVQWPGGNNALHVVAANGSVDLFRLLIEAGVAYTQNDDGNVPLLLAVGYNSADMVTFLLDAFNVILDRVYTYRESEENRVLHGTLFELAMYNKQHAAEVCQLLFDRGADIERVNEKGETPLFAAVRNDNYEAITWLISHGARLDVVNNEGYVPFSYIRLATESNQKKLVCAVLEGLSEQAGGLVTWSDAMEHSRHYALQNNIPAELIAKWKQSMKFDPFARMRAWCGISLQKDTVHLMPSSRITTFEEQLRALEYTFCQHGAYLYAKKIESLDKKNDMETVRRCMASGSNLAALEMQHGATLLHWAAKYGDAELLIELLEKHGLTAVINKETRFDSSALGCAATADCARILLDHGARITKDVVRDIGYKQNAEVCNVLAEYISASMGSEEIQLVYNAARIYGTTIIAAKCLSLGARPQENDVHTAVERQHAGIVSLLASHGVSITDANERAKQSIWNAGLLASIAVKNRDLACLKAVIETADASLLVAAASVGWHEGLCCLLEYGLLPDLNAEKDPLKCAIEGGSKECVQALINYVPLTEKHLKLAIGKAEIVRMLLANGAWKETDIIACLELAVERTAAESVSVLAPYVVSHGEGLAATNGSYFHKLAHYAFLFGVNEQIGAVCWKNRVQHIRWLHAWKMRVLQAKEVDCVVELSNETVQKVVSTLHALMTAPVYSSAAEHKEILYRLLQRRFAKADDMHYRSWQTDKEECTAYELAQSQGNSTTFNDLFDPEKVEQWFGAIEHVYAARDALRHTNVAMKAN